MAYFISDTFVTALEEAGIISNANNVRRVVIDLKCGEIPVMHVEQYPDDKFLSVIRTLGGVEIRRE